MIKNQSNKEFLELLIGSGVRFFCKNQPNNFYISKTNKIFFTESTNKMDLKDIQTIGELTKLIKESKQCLLKNTASDLVSIANELKKGNVKKAHNKLINDYGNIVLYKVKCLNDVRKELQTSVWKRKITMYKNKKKYG